jgi:ubiquinone/menaquinone biosynthesis C-methylase UbiE
MAESIHPDDRNQSQWAAVLYDERAEEYERSWHPTFVKETFVPMLPLSPGDRVLDLACGTGLVSFAISSRVGPDGRVIGIDISPKMLAEAKAKKEAAGKEAAHVEFYLHSVTELDSSAVLEPASFDAITMASAFVLLEDPIRAIESFTRYLKPGGFIALDVTHEQSLLPGLTMEKVARRMGLEVPYHRSWITSEDDFRDLLDGAHLSIEKLETVSQRGGKSKTYTVDDAGKIFDEHVNWQGAHMLRRDKDTLSEARKFFIQEWTAGAVDGRVVEVDGKYIVYPSTSACTQSINERSVSGVCCCRYETKGGSF